MEMTDPGREAILPSGAKKESSVLWGQSRFHESADS